MGARLLGWMYRHLNLPFYGSLLPALLLISPLAAADDPSKVSFQSVYKDYKGSVEKSRGLEQRLYVDHTFDRINLGVGYQFATADRYQPQDLRVDKFSLTAGYALTDDLNGSVTYLQIKDNLSPTDGGKIYSSTLDWQGKAKKQSARLGVHYSNYDQFHVYQLDGRVAHRMRVRAFGIGMMAGAVYIKIDDTGNSRYVANAQSAYFAPQAMISVSKNGYYGRVGVMGKRAFEVVDGGRQVSHHAMELRRSYIMALGKKLKAVDVRFLVGHHLATELPPSNKLHINTYSLSLDYHF